MMAAPMATASSGWTFSDGALPIHSWMRLRTKGMRDFTMDGIHLCTVRLDLLTLNTMSALDPSRLSDVEALSKLTSAELRDLGRLPFPMVRRRGESGFSRVSWDEALDVVSSRIRESDPDRTALYLTSRGISNEVYYTAQKVARFLGTNNVDNSARVCHSPSTVAMKRNLGVSASTCSYKDWIGTDLLDYTVDRNPFKQNSFLVGSRIPVYPPGMIAQTKPDYVLVLRSSRISV